MSTPYSGTMRVQNITVGTQGVGQFYHKTTDVYTEKTDIGYLAITANGTYAASVEFELLIIDN